MKTKRWITIAVGLVLIGTFMSSTKINAQDDNNSVPNQIAELKALVTKLQDTVTGQQNEISTLKDTVSKLQEGSERPMGKLHVKIQTKADVTDQTDFENVVGQEVIIMDSQGKEYTGVTNENGEYTFTVPTGIYTYRLENDLIGVFGDDWNNNVTRAVSTEKTAEILIQHVEGV